MPYLTPDNLPTEFICRRLRLPNDVQWLEIVNGALSTLIKPQMFELFGAVTPEETAEFFSDMFFDYLKGEACMLGAIIPYATENAPDGTLPCDGSTHTKADYPRLYNALNSVYIIDSDTFKTPDLRGRTVIGAGEGEDLSPRVIGDTGGEETHVLLVAELAIHTHTTEDHTHTNAPHAHYYDHAIPNIDVESAGIPDPVAIGQPHYPALSSYETVSIDSENVTVNESGEDTPHNNMQPFEALRYCIVSR